MIRYRRAFFRTLPGVVHWYPPCCCGHSVREGSHCWLPTARYPQRLRCVRNWNSRRINVAASSSTFSNKSPTSAMTSNSCPTFASAIAFLWVADTRLRTNSPPNSVNSQKPCLPATLSITPIRRMYAKRMATLCRACQAVSSSRVARGQICSATRWMSTSPSRVWMSLPIASSSRSLKSVMRRRGRPLSFGVRGICIASSLNRPCRPDHALLSHESQRDVDAAGVDPRSLDDLLGRPVFLLGIVPHDPKDLLRPFKRHRSSDDVAALPIHLELTLALAGLRAGFAAVGILGFSCLDHLVDPGDAGLQLRYLFERLIQVGLKLSPDRSKVRESVVDLALDLVDHLVPSLVSGAYCSRRPPLRVSVGSKLPLDDPDRDLGGKQLVVHVLRTSAVLDVLVEADALIGVEGQHDSVPLRACRAMPRLPERLYFGTVDVLHPRFVPRHGVSAGSTTGDDQEVLGSVLTNELSQLTPDRTAVLVVPVPEHEDFVHSLDLRELDLKDAPASIRPHPMFEFGSNRPGSLVGIHSEDITFGRTGIEGASDTLIQSFDEPRK